MRQATIVHPGIAGKLGHFYPHRATVLEPSTVAISESGQRNPTFTPIDSVTDQECALEPRTGVRDTAAGKAINYTRSTHKLQFNGYHPAITHNCRVQINGGVTWEIEGVEHDTLQTITELFIWEQ